MFRPFGRLLWLLILLAAWRPANAAVEMGLLHELESELLEGDYIGIMDTRSLDYRSYGAVAPTCRLWGDPTTAGSRMPDGFFRPSLFYRDLSMRWDP